MPKPSSDRTGNGMHFHLSITDKDGQNLFHDADDKSGMGLSKLAYHLPPACWHMPRHSAPSQPRP